MSQTRRFVSPFPFLLPPFRIELSLLTCFSISELTCYPFFVSFFFSSPPSLTVRAQPPLPLLIYLFATLVTLTPSPLIEPRYFLLPFLVLRILASPSQETVRPTTTPASKRSSASTSPPSSSSDAMLASTSAATRMRRLEWIELGWYALVNVVTIRVFLRVKLRWESEEGVWQRFMW